MQSPYTESWFGVILKGQKLARTTGTVKQYNEAKGSGYIALEDGDRVLVLRESIVKAGFRTLKEGEKVEFEIVQGKQGPTAVNIRRI